MRKEKIRTQTANTEEPAGDTELTVVEATPLEESKGSQRPKQP